MQLAVLGLLVSGLESDGLINNVILCTGANDNTGGHHESGASPLDLAYLRSVWSPPKLAKPEPNRRFRARSALGRAGYFWMICRFTSARIFPQRGCKLN